ncbi:MBL fold metallo-hydrolase [Candidatus Microgenomates bacterium]|nr:MAG: MBL fold metallo-hydrolase [Candidatus Microgenomates bacterium]
MSDLEVVPLPVGQLRTNCYLVVDTKSRECMIVDPGDESEFISQKVLEFELTPVAIIATHGHFDHILAAHELSLLYSLPLFIHSDDLFLLKRMRETSRHFLNYEPQQQAPENTEALDNMQSILVGNFRFSILHTPGHTPGSVCLYETKEQLLISGDTLFAEGGVGRTDFSYSSIQQLANSLEQLFSLPESVRVYPGHGVLTTIGQEKRLHQSN